MKNVFTFKHVREDVLIRVRKMQATARNARKRRQGGAPKKPKKRAKVQKLLTGVHAQTYMFVHYRKPKTFSFTFPLIQTHIMTQNKHDHTPQRDLMAMKAKAARGGDSSEEVRVCMLACV